METITIRPGHLSLDDLKLIHLAPCKIELDPACQDAVDKATNVVNQVIIDELVVYGINTGFGLLANTKIDASELEVLQRSIVLSHAAGIGKLMDASTVRLLMLLKVNALSRGNSGIRFELIQALITLINKEIYPCIPIKGSVGASGDLAPLAHMSAVLLGEGEATYRGELISAGEALNIAGLKAVSLAPKEGLALLNGLRRPQPLPCKVCLMQRPVLTRQQLLA